MEREGLQEKAMPVTVDAPLHVREKTRIMTVLRKHQSIDE